jgi:hypothetical protein
MDNRRLVRQVLQWLGLLLGMASPCIRALRGSITTSLPRPVSPSSIHAAENEKKGVASGDEVAMI